jgi:enoyl-CoA hydratase/carnithine racemase
VGRVEREDRPDGVRVLTLANPAKRNALDVQMLAQLQEALAAPGARALLLRGDDASFCAGYDLEALGQVAEGVALPDELLCEVLDQLEAHPAPSVALVRKAAFGAGCELAAACDFRVGALDAVFCLPPARLGIVYAPEGLARLARVVGWPRAKLLFLTGRKIDAEEAHRMGLLDELATADVVPAGSEADSPFAPDADALAEALAAELATGAPLAVAGMKRGFSLLAKCALSEAESAELLSLRRAAFNSEDAREGRAAFLEKRSPHFSGH